MWIKRLYTPKRTGRFDDLSPGDMLRMIPADLVFIDDRLYNYPSGTSLVFPCCRFCGIMMDPAVQGSTCAVCNFAAGAGLAPAGSRETEGWTSTFAKLL
jgi:hypothetical protein